jgi:hypothetical protein
MVTRTDVTHDLAVTVNSQSRRRIFVDLPKLNRPWARRALDLDRHVDDLACENPARDPGISRPGEHEQVSEFAWAGVEELGPDPDVGLCQPISNGQVCCCGGGRDDVYQAP